MRDSVSHAINHKLRKQLIEALWHSSEPLSAKRFYSEFVNDGRVTLALVIYHVRQLNGDGIVQVFGESGAFERRVIVLDGPNSGEAVRRLGLTAT